MKWVLGLLLLAGLKLNGNRAANILVFYPFPARSHMAVFESLVRDLADVGHQVTAVSNRVLPDPPQRNYRHIVIDDLLHEIHDLLDINRFGDRSPLSQGKTIHDMGLYLQERVCAMPEVQGIIHSEDMTFDLVVLESLFNQEGFSAFQHKFNAPGVDVMPMGSWATLNHATGNPWNPSYIVDFKSRHSDHMSFFERLDNTIISLGSVLMNEVVYLPRNQKIMDSCFNYTGHENRPPLRTLIQEKALVMVNSHYSLNYPYPIAPNFVEVGGIHIRPSKPLPKDIKAFMDEAEHGVIFFSLGSNLNVSDIATADKFQAFLSVFKGLKQRVLWKWEVEFPDQPDNVKIAKWFPQQDILAHNNCVLFITHGGFLSISESVSFGVPLVGIPFFGDQPKNMRQVTTAGYGLELEFENITRESVDWAVHEVLNNPKYTEEVKRRQAMFHSKPMPARDAAVFWIEHVLMFKGGSHLKPAITYLHFYQYLHLDIIAFLLAIFYVFIKAIIRVISLFRKQNVKLKKT